MPQQLLRATGLTVSWHYRYSLTELVEELAARTERGVEAKLSSKSLARYRAAGYEDDRPVTT